MAPFGGENAESYYDEGVTAGMKGDLEALPQFRIESLPIPSGKPRQHCQVGGAGNRHQLSRPLYQSEDECPLSVTGSVKQSFDPIPV